MRLLLDSHAFLWFVWDDPRLSPTAKRLIEDVNNDLYISVAGIWEIAIKVSSGKLNVGQELGSFLSEQMQHNRIDLLPISLPHVVRVSILPVHHKDPFDRLLIAQSLVEQIAVIGIDGVFDEYGVQRLW